MMLMNQPLSVMMVYNCVFVVVGFRRFLPWLSKSLPFGCRIYLIRFLRILIFRQESDWQKEVSARKKPTKPDNNEDTVELESDDESEQEYYVIYRPDEVPQNSAVFSSVLLHSLVEPRTLGCLC
jgi:hypothetical protein